MYDILFALNKYYFNAKKKIIVKIFLYTEEIMNYICLISLFECQSCFYVAHFNLLLALTFFIDLRIDKGYD